MNVSQGVDLSSDEIGKAIEVAYQGKFLNLREQMPIKLRDGSVILKTSVSKIESLTGRN